MTDITKLIGLTGLNGAGKGEAARFFQKNGFDYYSLSDIIRGELIRKGKKITRDHMIRMGNELRRVHGSDILARRIMEKVKGSSVIDSIRSPMEIAYFRRYPGFILLAIDAPPEIRYKRTMQRGRDESAETFEEFMAKESEEKTDKESNQQLHTCMNMADAVILNDSTLATLHHRLEEFL
jgi:dephospho-CoA kinase